MEKNAGSSLREHVQTLDAGFCKTQADCTNYKRQIFILNKIAAGIADRDRKALWSDYSPCDEPNPAPCDKRSIAFLLRLILPLFSMLAIRFET